MLEGCMGAVLGSEPGSGWVTSVVLKPPCTGEGHKKGEEWDWTPLCWWGRQAWPGWPWLGVPGGTGVSPACHGHSRHGGAGRPGRTSGSEGLCCLRDVGGRVGTKTSGENSSRLSCALGWDAE